MIIERIAPTYGNVTLKSYYRISKRNLNSTLQIAAQISGSLHIIHTKGSIYKSINPTSIIINSGTLKTDLVEAAPFFEKGGLVKASRACEMNDGSSDLVYDILPYISPEQTGRTDTIIDKRSDLYSFGIVLYEMLTGEKAFKHDKSLEIIHSHIARDPLCPSEVNPDVPGVLSDIVMKLLEKSPEARYQSAIGVKNDIDNCLETLTEDGHIEHFSPGLFDFADTFRLTDKFYGRKKEFELITKSYERVAAGASEILSVSGYSGIGKTSLVLEFSKKYMRAGGAGKRLAIGYGKLEKLEQSVPFSAISAALGEIMSRILNKDKSEIDYFKQRILKKIDTNGKLIIDLIPELEMIIGPQPDLPELDTSEAQNRFNIVFQGFVCALATPSAPLVVFLDDIQWIDFATLRLLEGLSLKKIPNLLVICAYRENEVDHGHKLIPVFEKLRTGESFFGHIHLGPLDFNLINKIIIDSLKIDRDNADFLTNIITEKSGGNPYYIKEFLTALYDRKLVSFNKDRQLDQAKIKQISITENVAELVAGRLAALPESQLAILKTASCLGRVFKKNMLLSVVDHSERCFNDCLRSLIQTNYIVKINEGLFSFSHDRIQEAAHDFVNTETKKQIHYRTGTILLKQRNCKKTKVSVFEIVKHLNNAGSLVCTFDEKKMLAALNMEAGVTAKKGTAYDQAFEFLKKGIDLLPQDKWQEAYDQTLSFFLEASEIAFQVSDAVSADVYIDEILVNAATVFDKIKAIKIRIGNYTVSMQHEEALSAGKDGLKLLGINMPEKMSQLVILSGLAEAKIRLVGKDMETLSNIPKLSDPEKAAAVDLLAHCYAASIIGNPDYLPFIVLKILNITLKYGETSSSAYGYAIYGAILCDAFGNYKDGVAFGQLALHVADKYNDDSLKSRVNMIFGSMLSHWDGSIRAADFYLGEAYRYGMKNCCDLQFAGFSIVQKCWYQFLAGKRLMDVDPNSILSDNTVFGFHHKRISEQFQFLNQFLTNLKGGADNPLVLKSDTFDGDATIASWEALNENLTLSAAYMLKLMLGYILRDFHHLEKAIEGAEKHIDTQPGMPSGPNLYFYASLILIERYPDASLRDRALYLKKINKYRKKLKQYARVASENFYCMHALVEAQFAVFNGKDDIAVDLYDKAILSAEENGFTHFEAMANECAGYYYLETNKNHFAEYYMAEAKRLYAAWGAKAKVTLMEEAFPEFFSEEIAGKEPETNFDLVSIIKASQAIAGENEIEPLMDKLMAIVIENAGAREGFLVVTDKKGASIVIARVSANHQAKRIPLPAPIERFADISKSVVRYTKRVGEIVVLSNASNSGTFIDTDYFKNNTIKSVLCIPIKENGSITGVMYLENNRIEGAFTPERVEALKAVTEVLVNARAKKNAEEELGIYQGKLRALSSEVLLSEEKERRKIAIGLHDQIGQSLTLSRMQLGLIKREATSNKTVDKVDDIISLINQAISDTRYLTFELSPPDLYELGLEAALDTLSEKMLEPHGIRISFKDDLQNKPLDESTGILIFQGVREILFNVIKHADAKYVELSVGKALDTIRVEIKDDGKGFEPVEAYTGKKHTKSFGLFSVRERMLYHGGKIEIASEAGKGSCVTLISPLSTERFNSKGLS